MNKNFVLKVLSGCMGSKKEDHDFILSLACSRLLCEFYDYENKPISLLLYKEAAKEGSSIIDEAVKRLSDDKIIIGEDYVHLSGEHDTYLRLRKPVVNYIDIYRHIVSHPD